MIVIEIPPNPNCEAVEMRVFHDLEPARQIAQVRLEREAGKPVWYEVTGWTVRGAPCPALAQKVDDSGDGTAFLIYGGDAGLRFRSAGTPDPWQLNHLHQWGEPFLILIDINELRFSPSAKKTA